MFVSRELAALLIACAAVSSAGPEAHASEAAVSCINQASGTTWQIRIDYDKHTVDSNPARISDASISWHDKTDGGNYTLDRMSGKLTVIVASSTGGYFLHHQCRLEN
jgi:hypothetical protein